MHTQINQNRKVNWSKHFNFPKIPILKSMLSFAVMNFKMFILFSSVSLYPLRQQNVSSPLRVMNLFTFRSEWDSEMNKNILKIKILTNLFKNLDFWSTTR